MPWTCLNSNTLYLGIVLLMFCKLVFFLTRMMLMLRVTMIVMLMVMMVTMMMTVMMMIMVMMMTMTMEVLTDFVNTFFQFQLILTTLMMALSLFVSV